MARYSVQPRDSISVKGYGFLSFAKNMGKNISKNFSGKYGQKLLDHAKQSATDLSKKAIQKTAEATGNLVRNKVVDKITRVRKTSPKKNSETNEEEILRERFIPPEPRQKIIDDLRLKEENY